MTFTVTKISRMAFAAYLGAEVASVGVPGWTALSTQADGLLISKPGATSKAGDAFNVYHGTIDGHGPEVSDGARFQSTVDGRYVVAQTTTAGGAERTAFAAVADTMAEAAQFVIYTYGATSYFWWYDPSQQLWAGLTNLASTQFGGNGVVVASETTRAQPYLLPWKAEGSDPEWTYVIPLGWQVPRGSDLSYVDFTQTQATKFPFDFSACKLDETVLTGKQLGSARFVGCDLSETVLTPPLGATADAWIDFSTATLPYASLGNDWRFLMLGGATITDFPAQGATPPIDATGTCLASVSMADWALAGADFSGAQLVDGRMTGAGLKGASFKGAVLAPAGGSGTASPCALPTKGDPPATLSDADLADADLSDAFLEGVSFVNASLQGKDATVEGATLRSADFTGAHLEGIDFSVVADRDLTGTRFSGATLTGATLSQANMVGAYLTGALLRGATMAGVQLGEVGGVQGADLDSVYMPDAVLTDANLFKANMAYAQVYGGNARLDNANLRQADLTNATLAGMDLSQAHLEEAILDGANLIGCNLSGTQLISVGLAHASLQGADFTGAKLDGAHLANAAVALDEGTALFSLASTFAATLDAEVVDQHLTDAFQKAAYPLLESAAIEVVQQGSTWTISEELPPPNEPGLGYIGFSLVKNSDSIAVYGSMLAVARLGDNGKLQVVSVAVKATKLTPDVFSDTTVCPNQKSYGENKSLGLSWAEMMTAPSLPVPPSCVPSPTHFCPPSTALGAAPTDRGEFG